MGYMASGKSLIGKLLAKKMHLEFYDLDNEIELNNGENVSTIFKIKGEIYFRKLENKVLKHLLETKADCIIAIGGGTPCYGNNISIINKLATSIYLKASVSTLYNRLKKEKNKRPLVASINTEDLPEFIGKHLFERQQFYLQAKHKIETDNKNSTEIIDEITALI